MTFAFDHVRYPQKVLKNLISICDAIDATTDTNERNSAVPKTLDTVLQEFEQRKKTRYSPLIVDLLIFIAELRDNLRELLISGRKESYEFVYLLPDSS